MFNNKSKAHSLTNTLQPVNCIIANNLRKNAGVVGKWCGQGRECLGVYCSQSFTSIEAKVSRLQYSYLAVSLKQNCQAKTLIKPRV